MLRTLDLFSGIGGFSLGLERTGGFETVAFCEIEPFCRRVLSKHWPGVPIYEDVRELSADTLRRDGIADIDVICGGFPCQDISTAGKRAGLEGERSGLWDEYRRVIGNVRPRFVIVENVTGLLSLGVGTVLRDLAALGYDAIWDCIPACAVGAPHRRDRIWIVAYATDAVRRAHGRSVACSESESQGKARERCVWEGDWSAGDDGFTAGGKNVADTDRRRGETIVKRQSESGTQSRTCVQGKPSASDVDGSSWWLAEPGMGRMAYGVPARLDRLRALGNAIVPQVAEIVGRAILSAD